MPDTRISGERLASLASERFKSRAIIATMDAPNLDSNPPGGGAAAVNPLLGFDLSAFDRVVWDVVIEAGTPTFKWETWRYVEGAGVWILGTAYTAAALAVSTTIEQPCSGDRVFLRLTSVAAAPGEILRIYCRGVNRAR